MNATLERQSEMVLPARFLWTREKYEHATELGLFGPDDRIELVKGEIVQKMPQNSPHSTAYRLTEKTLNRVFGEGYDVRGQLPLTLDDESQPEPDLAVVQGSPRDFKSAQPTARSSVLVVEISDTTLPYDRITKAAMYAESGVPEYWIINLKDRLLEVHREPMPMEDRLFGHGYRLVQHLAETENASPLVAGGAVISVADLLP